MRAYSISSVLRASLLARAVFGIVVIALLSLIIVSLSLPYTNWYYTTYKHGIQFVGAKNKNGQIEYFSVRVGGLDAQAIPAECDLVFHLKGEKYLIREIELNDVAEMDVDLTTITNDADGITRASIAGNDTRHQDFVVEFHFANGRIYHFYAWHSSISKTVCPFMFSNAQQNPISLPIGEQDMQKCLGIPESVVVVPGK
jgi:hypothetical protein